MKGVIIMSFEHGLGQLVEVDGNIINLRVRIGILNDEKKKITEMQYRLEDIDKKLARLRKELAAQEEEREMILGSHYGEEML